MWCTHRPNSHCKFILIYKGGLIHKETWSAASFGWAEGLQTINPPIYRLTTAVSDIDQTNINRDIRDGNWLSNHEILSLHWAFLPFLLRSVISCTLKVTSLWSPSGRLTPFRISTWLISKPSKKGFVVTFCKKKTFRSLVVFFVVGWN